MYIFELEDDVAAAKAVLVIPFAAVQSMEPSVFRSGSGNYIGGQVRIVGRFDRKVNGTVIEERVTFQMPLDAVFHEFVETSQNAWNKIRNN